ncbi:MULTISPECIES: hydrogenase maturation nickel metallochaperone HypA [Bradyrhizobium]|uniref:Hydrogenase maturation factor HypA n=3 Tax=Bradyrhizobium TaxID=374 RepID=A0AAE5X9I9_9BRAD|nr:MULTISPECIES: hydrogenase maturation nickel metallochaperone HypA [Bradyrhizobium]MCG2628038.1 hydrogenase maturation nickel metallochaperone HypA [Bradyrhizobium zhengyangense]MCG2643157.1 hydrogenase maturation nickel metallochaperone HypA [Bradyrhizobium zhengyangense]MCG2670529.1 hydrogenase maturation nickel metallochaperone HypA [Bradyrhizobium zhengyangense]MDN4985736.1 hydrogenase maturation nickel metallochaperone HypA [Bradyrhizobium sp. WYCCWR 13022]MDT4736577.1 hydrogenase matur
MHEMALCEGIIGIVEEEARKRSFLRVKAVCLEIGALSHVAPDAMQFCFEAVAARTIAQGARLEIIATPGTAWCMACSQNVEIKQRYEPCPSCGSYQLQVTGGEEMRVKELEVD